MQFRGTPPPLVLELSSAKGNRARATLVSSLCRIDGVHGWVGTIGIGRKTYQTLSILSFRRYGSANRHFEPRYTGHILRAPHDSTTPERYLTRRLVAVVVTPLAAD